MTRKGPRTGIQTRRFDLRKKGNARRGKSYGRNLQAKGYPVEFIQQGKILFVGVYPKKWAKRYDGLTGKHAR